jgi:hypothetical protein
VGVALRGNLEDFGIADVFQLIGQQRKTGVLEFRADGDGHLVQLRFDRGAVVSAAPAGNRAEEALADMLVRCGKMTSSQLDELNSECEAAAQTAPRLALAAQWIEEDELNRIEDLLTRETFFDLLRWERGAFDFENQPIDHARSFETLLGAEQILMDGLRMVDEWQSLSEIVPEDMVFQRAAGFEEYRRRASLDASLMNDAECVYQLVDGRMAVRRIVDLSLLGTFDAVRLLADLRRAKVIEPLAEEARLRLLSKPAVRRVQLGAGEALGWLTALGALAALVALYIVARPTAVAIAPSGFAIERSARARVHDAHAARRARHAVEAWRFAEGRWPSDLGEVATSALLPDGALATSPSRPYYYFERDEGVLLLAPPR